MLVWHLYSELSRLLYNVPFDDTQWLKNKTLSFCSLIELLMKGSTVFF